MYKWNPFSDVFDPKDKTVVLEMDLLDEKLDEIRDSIFNVIRKNLDCTFYIYMHKFFRFQICIPKDWDTIQKHMIVWMDDICELDRFCDLNIYHRYIITNSSPLDERVQAGKIECVICKGNSHVLLYEDVLKIREECIKRKIDFIFYSTGMYLKKENITYSIPSHLQIEQAKKANLNVHFDWFEIDIFQRLARSKFRNQFHLKKKDQEYIRKVGMEQIQKHAYEFVENRLSAAVIENDGKQTPMKGHPVFVAQHATACCCRGCLNKWHRIEENRELKQEEKDYIVTILMKWLSKELM